MGDIFTKIKLHYNTFTKAQKKVADVVLNDPRSILYKSITELAEVCSIGDATVYRFCRDLDFKGYQDFKMALAQSLSVNESETGSNKNMISKQDPVSIMARKILAENIEALNETNKLINEEDIEKAVNWMIDAERVLFFGVGSSYHTALEGCYKFMRITPKAVINSDTHMQYVTASLITENDVAVIVSSSGATKETVEFARMAKQNMAKTVCVTSFVKSPITEVSDISLICGNSARKFQGQSLSVEVTQLYLMDVLFMEYFRKTYEQSMKNSERSLTLNQRL